MPYINRLTGEYVETPTGDPANFIAIESPSALATETVPPAFTLPGSTEAMTGFRNLQTQGISGLQGLLGEDVSVRRQAIEDALFGRSKEAIDRQAGDLGRDIREGTFGRNVGLSTITGDMLDRLNREQLDAISRAKREAFLGAGAETRSEDAARIAALGQAFSEGTQALGQEAGIGQANAARQQQGRQAAAQTAFENLLNRLNRQQQAGQFGAELGSRERLQERQIKSSEDIASSHMLAGGVASGIGGLATLFGPALTNIFGPTRKNVFGTT